MNEESKVVYQDLSGQVRAIRGTVEYDGEFIVIHRRDGDFRIARRLVAYIESWRGERGSA